MKKYILLLSLAIFMESPIAIAYDGLYSGSYQSSTYTSTSKPNMPLSSKYSSTTYHESRESNRTVTRQNRYYSSHSKVSKRTGSVRKEENTDIYQRTNTHNRRASQQSKIHKHFSNRNQLSNPVKAGNPYNSLNSKYATTSTHMSRSAKTYDKNAIKFK